MEGIELTQIMQHPIIRMLVVITFMGIFFNRDLPGAKSKWYYVFYWLLFILFFGYYGLSAMVSAGVSELFSKYGESGTVSPALENQLTITSLVLLCIYRVSSRYLKTEKNKWTADFIKGILISYLTISALFYAFADYLVESPRLEAFSGTPLAYGTLGIVFTIDFVCWLRTRKTDESV